jgi:hypothetical protein
MDRKKCATIRLSPSAVAAMGEVSAMNRAVQREGAQKARVLDPGNQPVRRNLIVVVTRSERLDHHSVL